MAKKQIYEAEVINTIKNKAELNPFISKMDIVSSFFLLKRLNFPFKSIMRKKHHAKKHHAKKVLEKMMKDKKISGENSILEIYTLR